MWETWEVFGVSGVVLSKRGSSQSALQATEAPRRMAMCSSARACSPSTPQGSAARSGHCITLTHLHKDPRCSSEPPSCPEPPAAHLPAAQPGSNLLPHSTMLYTSAQACRAAFRPAGERAGFAAFAKRTHGPLTVRPPAPAGTGRMTARRSTVCMVSSSAAAAAAAAACRQPPPAAGHRCSSASRQPTRACPQCNAGLVMACTMPAPGGTARVIFFVSGFGLPISIWLAAPRAT